MTPAEMTKALTTIDTTAANARRAYNRQANVQVVHQYLLRIQTTAQAAMQGVDIDARKLAAFDGLLAACERYHAQFKREVHRDEATALSLADASRLYNDACAAIASAKTATTPDSPGK